MAGNPSIDAPDLVVVGAGVAAMTAAISAKQNGARVLVLEKTSEPEQGGNSRISGGTLRFVYKGIEDILQLRGPLPTHELQRVEIGSYDEEDYLKDIDRATRSEADPDLARTLVYQSYPTIGWMTSLGVEWEWTTQGSVEVDGKLRFNPGSILASKDLGAGMMRALYAAAINLGISIRYNSEMVGFLRDTEGSLKGVQVAGPDGDKEIRCKAVFLGSGGFVANSDMRENYLGSGWVHARLRGAPANTGGPLTAALDIGASPYGQWEGCNASPVDGGVPGADAPVARGWERLSYTYGIMVNDDGRRFMDEGEDLRGLTFAKVARAIMTQPGGMSYQIFDSKSVHLVDKIYSQGSPVIAETISDAALELSIPVDVLEGTVAAYNDAVQPGIFDPAVRDSKSTMDIDPPKSNWAQTIDTPPYHVYPVTAAASFTYGGLKIDVGARVINTSDQPIEGLYAGGEIAGGFIYHTYPNGGSLMRSAVFGRIGGANAARYALALPRV